MRQRKKTVKIIILFIFLIAAVFLLVNKTTLKLFHRCIEYYNLKSDLKILETENKNYKETLYLLENKPSYIQKIVKSELGVIGEGEVLYVFEQEEDSNEN